MELELYEKSVAVYLKSMRITFYLTLGLTVLSFTFLINVRGVIGKLFCIIFLICCILIPFIGYRLFNAKNRIENQRIFLKKDLFVYAMFDELSERTGRMNYYLVKSPKTVIITRLHIYIKGCFICSSALGDGSTMFEWRETGDGKIVEGYDKALKGGRMKYCTVKIARLLSYSDEKAILSLMKKCNAKITKVSTKKFLKRLMERKK